MGEPEMTDPGKLQAAADRLEELAIELKGVIIALRCQNDDSYAYVYYFRKEVSRVVSTLGVGVPPPLFSPKENT
jgi:hypothetical protein